MSNITCADGTKLYIETNDSLEHPAQCYIELLNLKNGLNHVVYLSHEDLLNILRVIKDLLDV